MTRNKQGVCWEMLFQSSGQVPNILWIKHVSNERPELTCSLTHLGQTVHIAGMLDTGADITDFSCILAVQLEFGDTHGCSPRNWRSCLVSAKWIHDYCSRSRGKDSNHLSLRGAEAHHSTGERRVVPVGIKGRRGFLMKTTAMPATLKLSWKTNQPIWIAQWPLEQKKWNILKKLVNE